MGQFDNMKEKVEGKADEVKGDFEKQAGEGVKGGLTKLKGKAKSKMADIKQKIDSEKEEKG